MYSLFQKQIVPSWNTVCVIYFFLMIVGVYYEAIDTWDHMG